ncbi:MAG: ATP-dependent zinc protease [Bdellovibrionales bacterium]|nr:ATP-dependent zinc protease [Bdellovibrionales bacterium]
MTDNQQKPPTIIGFREWISLPALHLVALKAKIDTGAKTSSLHAFEIKHVKRGGKSFVRFKVHPIQKNLELVVSCLAPLVDRRVVTDSGGHQELRYVIHTTIQMGGIKKVIELTLSNRESMKYRMLIGREALKQFYIDPSQSYLLKKNQKQRNYLKDIKLGIDPTLEKEV